MRAAKPNFFVKSVADKVLRFLSYLEQKEKFLILFRKIPKH